MEHQNIFIQHTQTALQTGTFSKLTLSNPRSKSAGLRNVYGRLIVLKAAPHLSCTLRYQTRDETKNYALTEIEDVLTDWLNGPFRQADLFTETTHWTLLISKKGKATLRQQTIQQKRSSGAVQHDHAKARSIATDSPYLHALGITNKQGKVLQQGQRKFRQINKYLELIGHLLEQQPLRDQAHIVDMGSGKGYLTFALYDYLQRQQNVQLTGIELRPKLVKQCNEVAQECNFEHLRFLAQDIHDFQPDGGIDMLIALHACDTATDEAIAKGIRAEAQLIVVAPCCHKQVRKAMQPPNKLQPMLQHGILLERQAEMLTDAIRSLLLEAHGYETKVFEFINTAHTPKNVMITAVKGRPNQAALGQIAALKRQFGINFHHLERLLAN